ncbi:immunoglobulin lambda-1 light chain-like isoform X2 [Carcharodon carcharias]|uniref:immunoglobulin lambda-1 light chain-like isoform X2 n=1 Tax=Carcharodon carcharias TaxID=13397 RepID=UPI001B7F5DC2|nr:immunoglobulin lambda-1 light chain-like isoform X2 [Carcharodon carcharias]
MLLRGVALVLFFLHGYFAQDLKQNQLSITKKHGRSTTITCELGESVSSSAIHWYKQAVGKQPVRILYIDKTVTRDDGFDERFEAEKTGNRQCILRIKNIKAEDSATYYCAYTSGSWKVIFGSGTRLIVSDKLAVKPTIRLFPPNSTEMKSKKKALVVCLLTGFFPEVIRVEWTIDGEGKAREERVFTDPVVKQGNDAYSVISRLEVTELQWESKNINCKADHEGGSGTAMINKDYKTDMKKPSAPTCPPPVSEAAENASEVLSEPPLNALQVATFTYTLLLMKSVVYCGIISFVLYRVEYRDTKKPL